MENGRGEGIGEDGAYRHRGGLWGCLEGDAMRRMDVVVVLQF